MAEIWNNKDSSVVWIGRPPGQLILSVVSGRNQTWRLKLVVLLEVSPVHKQDYKSSATVNTGVLVTSLKPSSDYRHLSKSSDRSAVHTTGLAVSMIGVLQSTDWQQRVTLHDLSLGGTPDYYVGLQKTKQKNYPLQLICRLLVAYTNLRRH